MRIFRENGWFLTEICSFLERIEQIVMYVGRVYQRVKSKRQLRVHMGDMLIK